MASRVSAACIFALALLIAPLAGTNGNFVADWSFKGPTLNEWPPVTLASADSWARGGKVWYSDLTGLKPIKMEDAVDDRFLKAAHAKYPA